MKKKWTKQKIDEVLDGLVLEFGYIPGKSTFKLRGLMGMLDALCGPTED